MATFWLKDENTGATYVLDEQAYSISMPAMSRQLGVSDSFGDSAIINGSGGYKAGVIQITKSFKKGTYSMQWNALRYAFMQWIGQPKQNILWFYLFDGTVTMRVRVYPVTKGAETYRNFYTSGEVPFVFQMETAYFQDVALKYVISTFGETYSDQPVTVTNGGNIKTPPIISFVVDSMGIGALTLWQVQLSTNYGFRLEYAFQAGHEYTYDCSTGRLTEDLSDITAFGALTAGSPFSIEPGINVLANYAGKSTASGYQISWYERYI